MGDSILGAQLIDTGIQTWRLKHKDHRDAQEVNCVNLMVRKTVRSKAVTVLWKGTSPVT